MLSYTRWRLTGTWLPPGSRQHAHRMAMVSEPVASPIRRVHTPGVPTAVAAMDPSSHGGRMAWVRTTRWTDKPEASRRWQSDASKHTALAGPAMLSNELRIRLTVLLGDRDQVNDAERLLQYGASSYTHRERKTRKRIQEAVGQISAAWVWVPFAAEFVPTLPQMFVSEEARRRLDDEISQHAVCCDRVEMREPDELDTECVPLGAQYCGGTSPYRSDTASHRHVYQTGLGWSYFDGSAWVNKPAAGRKVEEPTVPVCNWAPDRVRARLRELRAAQAARLEMEAA